MKSIGKIDTQTLLILGAGAVILYMTMNKKVTPMVLPTTSAQNLIAYQSAAAGNSTGGIITSAGTAAGAIMDGLSNFF